MAKKITLGLFLSFECRRRKFLMNCYILLFFLSFRQNKMWTAFRTADALENHRFLFLIPLGASLKSYFWICADFEEN